MAEGAHILLDATAARQPEAGVQHAVRREAEELKSLLPGSRCISSNCATRHPALRIAWQQLFLPWYRCRALYAMAYTAPLFCRVPYLLNVHDVIGLTHPELCSRKNAIQMRMLLPASLRHAAGIVASSEHVADEVHRLFPQAAVTVAPLGVDYDIFSAGGCNALPPGVRKPYFLFVGNLEPKKGLDTLLKAFLQGAAFQKPQLVIAGNAGWKCAGILSIIRRFPDRIVWLGRVADDSLPVLYRGAAAFLFPSLTEGFGLPVLEAMAAGTPVIHSDIPSLKQLSAGAALTFPAADSAALSAVMKRLVESPALGTELVQAGRERARIFTWRRRAEITAELLKEL